MRGVLLVILCLFTVPGWGCTGVTEVRKTSLSTSIDSSFHDIYTNYTSDIDWLENVESVLTLSAFGLICSKQNLFSSFYIAIGSPVTEQKLYLLFCSIKIPIRR